MTNVDSILKSGDIALLTKVQIVKAMVFPVVIYGCVCQQIWKTQQRPQDWKKSIFVLIPKKGNAKNVQTTI